MITAIGHGIRCYPQSLRMIPQLFVTRLVLPCIVCPSAHCGTCNTEPAHNKSGDLSERGCDSSVQVCRGIEKNNVCQELSIIITIINYHHHHHHLSCHCTRFIANPALGLPKTKDWLRPPDSCQVASKRAVYNPVPSALGSRAAGLNEAPFRPF